MLSLSTAAFSVKQVVMVPTCLSIFLRLLTSGWLKSKRGQESLRRRQPTTPLFYRADTTCRTPCATTPPPRKRWAPASFAATIAHATAAFCTSAHTWPFPYRPRDRFCSLSVDCGQKGHQKKRLALVILFSLCTAGVGLVAKAAGGSTRRHSIVRIHTHSPRNLTPCSYNYTKTKINKKLAASSRL